MSAATAAHPCPSPRSWPRPLAALAVRDYRLYLSSQVVATTGLWMQRIAQDWLVLELTGSVAAVGVVVALQFLPILLFGLVGGMVADRYPKRTILIVTQSVAALTALTLGLLALTGTVQAWHVFVVAAVSGLVTVVDNPTRQVFVSELVGPRHIGNAVSLNASVFQLGALVGPALAGVLIHSVGQGLSFVINAAACLGVVVMLAVIRPVRAPRRTGAARRGQLREGLRIIRRTSEVAWSIVLVAAVGLLGLNMPVILAAFADHEFGLGVGGYSLFSSLVAVGALSGAGISARRTGTLRLRALVGILALLGIGLAAAAAAPGPWLFGALLILVGLCTLLFLTGANALVQTAAAPEVRGRVMSVYLIVLLGGQAVGGPAAGWLIEHIGPRASMTACGAGLAAVALIAAVALSRQARLGLAFGWSSRGRRPSLHIVPAGPGH